MAREGLGQPRRGFTRPRERNIGGSISIVGGLDEEIERRKAVRANQQTPFLEYAVRLPEPKTGTLDFERFPFQPEMFEAFGSPRKDVRAQKCVQVGASAGIARAALYSADILAENALYIFPSKTDVWDFVDDRIEGMIRESDYLRTRVGPAYSGEGVDNKGLKRVGPGMVYFRGSNAKSGLQSAAIDLLILDEYDELNMKHIPDAERRIAGSLNGRIRRVGNPTYPDYGINLLFQATDQRWWLVRCEHCRVRGNVPMTSQPLRTPGGGGWQALHFFENVDTDRRRIVCGGCGEPLNTGAGRWVAQNPDATIPGFQISRLMVPGIDKPNAYGERVLDEIIFASESRGDEEIQAFWNKDLGLPFEPKEGRISLEALAAARSIDIQWDLQMGYSGGNFVTMGVDVASVRALNVRISEWLDDERNRKRALWVGEIEAEPGTDPVEDVLRQLGEMMDRFQVNMAVVDHEPEYRMSMALAARFPARVYVCNYAESQREALKVDPVQRKVSVRRTPAMDSTRRMMAEQRNILPQSLPATYIRQMRSPIRSVKTNEFGEKKAVYTSTGPDDYYHCETYDMVAREVMIIQMELDEAMREEEQPLDDLMPFKRSDVDDLEGSEWSAGPPGDYSPGPSEWDE